MSFALPVLAGGRNIRTLNSAGLAALCFAAFVGFAGMNVRSFSVALAMLTLLVLLAGYAGGGYVAAAAGFLAGLGVAVQTSDISYLAMYAVAAIASAAFSRGWKAVRFERAPALDLVYAFSGRAKSGQSGDTYSASCGGSRAMLSLCDGKGNGEHAAALSGATLAVIEGYYQAGFDAVETVSVAGSMLAAGIGEDFSALDVVSIDLISGSADIIKAGSPPTYIIKKDNLLRIEGGALPVGALEAARPALSRQLLVPGDVVVLMSDGITDSLPEVGELLGGAQTFNMQKLADDLVARAIKASAKDDTSVLAARVIERS